MDPFIETRGTQLSNFRYRLGELGITEPVNVYVHAGPVFTSNYLKVDQKSVQALRLRNIQNEDERIVVVTESVLPTPVKSEADPRIDRFSGAGDLYVHSFEIEAVRTMRAATDGGINFTGAFISIRQDRRRPIKVHASDLHGHLESEAGDRAHLFIPNGNVCQVRINKDEFVLHVDHGSLLRVFPRSFTAEWLKFELVEL